MAETLSKEEFCTRFEAEMITAAPIYGGSKEELAAYAAEIAPSYFETDWQRAEGPEACAQSDISYWEEG